MGTPAKTLVRRKAPPHLRWGPRRGRTIERAPGRCPGPLCVLFTCTAPPDESDARSGPWRPTPAGLGPLGTPSELKCSGRQSRPCAKVFAFGENACTAQSAAPPAVGPRRGRTIERAPGRCPGPLCVLFTCTAPPDESDARNGPWRPLRSRRRAPWRARGRSGSGWSSGPRSSGTPDSRRRGPWSPE